MTDREVRTTVEKLVDDCHRLIGELVGEVFCSECGEPLTAEEIDEVEANKIPHTDCICSDCYQDFIRAESEERRHPDDNGRRNV